MIRLKIHLDKYLILRRRLGFKLDVQSGLLRNFVRFAEQKNASRITTKLALRWATQSPHIKPAQSANRLGMVRQFAQYVSGIDPRTEIPPRKLLPGHFRRRAPHLYRNQDVLRLVSAARELTSPDQTKGVTYATLFGLLAVTGMRLGEALSLGRDDVDLDKGLITIRHAKGNKSRLIPLHSSTQQELQRYTGIQDRVHPHPLNSAFFLSERGTRLLDSSVNRWFLLLACQIGLRKPGDRRGPRIHDLRHHLAIQTLLRWYRSGADVEAHLPELSTYLGHAHVRHTYWYLSAVPELLQLAANRCQHWKEAR